MSPLAVGQLIPSLAMSSSDPLKCSEYLHGKHTKTSSGLHKVWVTSDTNVAVCVVCDVIIFMNISI
jgi:hypothetical protein